jgi:hypothetical protein
MDVRNAATALRARAAELGRVAALRDDAAGLERVAAWLDHEADEEVRLEVRTPPEGDEQLEACRHV